MSRTVHIIEHPLVQHKLTLMREKDTSTASFRKLLREISLLLAYEVTRELDMTTTRIETPLQPMDAPTLDGKKLALISILRAGNGLLDGILELIPAARVGFVGLYRDPETLQPVQYYCKLPEKMEDRISIVVDPMLATGSSLLKVWDLLKRHGEPRSLHIAAAIAAPEGLALLQQQLAFPASFWLGALDQCLNEQAYIVPGLGDAGDLCYGRKD